MSKHEPPVEAAAAPSRFRRLTRKLWWLHSLGALSFGVGVMIFARKGLAYADKLMMVLAMSWGLMFIALRFIVGPSNRSPDEGLHRKGVRLVTNYLIKNLYQQMFFFLVPLYAASATWSLASHNWWLPPLLLVCAVLSTMDLIFDNVIMEHRVIASLMYGMALFGVLNLMLPMVFHLEHFTALLIAAGATAPAVGLLTFRVRTVFSPAGLFWTFVAAGLLLGGAWFGRSLFPPAPMALADVAVGHGSSGSYECLPGAKTRMRADQLDSLRCASRVTEPGGVRDRIVHRWRHRGQNVPSRMDSMMPGCEIERGEDSEVDQSHPVALPADPTGPWQCIVETAGGQLVGLVKFEVIPAPPSAKPAVAPTEAPGEKPAVPAAGSDAGPTPGIAPPVPGDARPAPRGDAAVSGDGSSG